MQWLDPKQITPQTWELELYTFCMLFHMVSFSFHIRFVFFSLYFHEACNKNLWLWAPLTEKSSLLWLWALSAIMGRRSQWRYLGAPHFNRAMNFGPRQPGSHVQIVNGPISWQRLWARHKMGSQELSKWASWAHQISINFTFNSSLLPV